MKNGFIITNHYLESSEPTHEDHSSCDVFTQECRIGDPEPHLRLAAIARGKKIKSGIKILDLTLDEVKALAMDCQWQIYFTSPAHLEDGFGSARNIHYALRRFHRRLIRLQKAIEETQ